MTSTITGLPDRYRPLDEVGPEETTATGVIRCWRAKDRVLNRDVAIRVHSPGGPPAHAWIARALTAGGLANPALAMVYDAAEGTADESAPGSAAYVVNEWIEGETLAERLTRGPLPEREARTVLRRLADGVAEAHRVGLAVGGLTPEQVVLRPNGLVGLRAVPAASGSVQGDIAALGELLEACLTGRPAGGPPPRIAAPDLAALVRRARSSEPGQGLSSAAAMAALLAERPRGGRTLPSEPVNLEDSGWLRRLREHRRTDPDGLHVPSTHPGDAEGAPVRLQHPDMLPPVPPTRPVTPLDVAPSVFGRPEPLPGRAAFYDDDLEEDERVKHDVFGDDDDDAIDDAVDEDFDEPIRGRRRLMTVGLPVLALAVVIALAWWLGTNVLSVTRSVDEVGGSTPPSTAVSSSAAGGASAPAGAPAAIADARVFDPEGDGDPDNQNKVALSHDGDPATVWPTYDYRGSAAFGNLKGGVGVLYDLGSPQPLSGATLTTTHPGAAMEIRIGDRPDGALDDYQRVASATVDGTTEFTFDKPVTARYVLVWITSLAPSDAGFSADIAEISLHQAG